jgi:hypothetical protein
MPTSLTADCEGGRLFVASVAGLRQTRGAVTELDFASGRQTTTLPLPEHFLPRSGARFVAPDTLVLNGFWLPPDLPPSALIGTPPDRYYEAARLGLRVSVTSGATEPLVAPYEHACIGAGECPNVTADEIDTPTGRRAVAGLPTSTRIAVYERMPSGPGAPRTIDARSPGFVRDGRTLRSDAGVSARIEWTGTNTTIRQVVAFAESIGVVHARRIVPPGWAGQMLQEESFLNVYAWDGSPRAIDLPLPDPIVGQDATSLYAVDYGPDGRRDAMDRLRLVQIVVDDP